MKVMRKHFLKSLAVTVAILCMATGAFADGSTATATANASGQIITPITISKNTDLYFGKNIADTTAGGTVVIATDSTRTVTGNVVAGTAQFVGVPTAASFSVAGEPSATYAITLPASVTVTNPGAVTMTVDTFTSNPSATGALNISGAQTLLVGATLHVAMNQADGVYTAASPFSVTVNYN